MHIRKPLLAAILPLAAALAACDETPVNLPEATSVSVPAAEMKMTVGDAAPMAAQVLDQQGHVMSGRSVAYTSDNPSVASVDASGMVRATSPGTATVTAVFGSATAAAKVTVSRDERLLVKSLDVFADSLAVDVRAGTQILSLKGFNGFGQPVSPNVTVRSTDPSVVVAESLSGCRLSVSPQFRGTATLLLTADRGADSVKVRVTSDGAFAYIASRPAADSTYAGHAVTYAVRVVDAKGDPLAGRTVRFDVSSGGLSAENATTDANGVAAVRWTLPTNLTTLGRTHSLSYRTTLPNGLVAGATDYVYVSSAATASLVLYRFDWLTYTLQPIAENTTISSPLYNWVDVAAAGADAYGNLRTDGFTFSVTGPAYLDCVGWTINGYSRACWYGYGVGTGQLTVTNGTLSKSWNLDFHD